MRIYVDEDSASDQLVRLFRKAGHDLETPSGVNLLGRSDPVQFTFAISERRVFLTANYDDYEKLHLLVQEAHGHHPGILAVRWDNDPTRDLTPKGIVAAIRKLESAGVPIGGEYTVLNHWR